ncbi:SgcJ/EcaC family oxidoreductase [Oryzobacter telluris]|uniref:SgcJ/EcaC family oxidoreductase n=1 Tax=Oryzobacter telluris TaxID=3149179 RepID=UPI00370D30FA
MTTTTSPSAAEVASGPGTVALDVLGRLQSAWNAADGDAFGAVYTPDATFVTVRGELARGRDAIATGHSGIFTTIYAGSHNEMEPVSVRVVGEDTLVVVSEHTLRVPVGPLAGTHTSRATNVVTREAASGAWFVAATHNTLVQA